MPLSRENKIYHTCLQLITSCLIPWCLRTLRLWSQSSAIGIFSCCSGSGHFPPGLQLLFIRCTVNLWPGSHWSLILSSLLTLSIRTACLNRVPGQSATRKLSQPSLQPDREDIGMPAEGTTLLAFHFFWDLSALTLSTTVS